MSQHSSADPGSLGALVSGLAGDVQDLVRGEIALARAEFERKLDLMTSAGSGIVRGALLALAGLVVLLLGIAGVLGLVMPPWVALLIVGVVVMAIGAAMAKSAMTSLTLTSLVPERTETNLRKDAHMLKEHT